MYCWNHGESIWNARAIRICPAKKYRLRMPYTVNARRGGEPARMLLSEFEEAKWNEWLGSNDLKKLDGSDALTAQLAQAKIAYLMGKGNKSLVPVIILHDSWKAMQMLTDSNIRELVGIAPSNPFVFALGQALKM